MSHTNLLTPSTLHHGQSRAATPTLSRPTSSHALARPMDETLQKVLQEYVEQNLTDDEKEAFKSSSDIIEHLQEMQSNSKSLVSSSITDRVSKVLQCVKGFMGLLSAFIQQGPISSLVVGGVNCILTLVLGYIEFFEKLTEMMERIAIHLSYLSEYGKPIFQESRKVQEALGEAYCDLLGFYVKARRVFINKKGKPSYVQGYKLFFRQAWEPFEAQFGPIEARFSDHTIAVVRSANIHYQTLALEFQNQSLEFQNRSLEHYKGEDEIRRLEDDKKHKEEAFKMRKAILKWLAEDDFEETHERHFKKRFANTGQWLLDDPRFRDWRDGDKSSVLWCYGAPGSGKTVLASLVTDHLSSRYELSANAGITFVYCNYKESRSTPTYIRLTLKQLCRSMPSLPQELQELYKLHDGNDSQPKSQELKAVFLEIRRKVGRILFVLDALDECPLDQRKELCEFLLSIAQTSLTSTEGIVKLFVTSRRESDIERAFQQQSIPTIEVEAAKVNNDINVYVRAQIELRLENGSLRLRNTALKEKILNTLTAKAGGMFLWAEFQLDAICAEPSDIGIEEALGRVPEDMDSTYERILGRINGGGRTQRKLAIRTLIWTAYARKPLSIKELAYAISIEKGFNGLESSIPTEEFIINACANLVSVDKSRGRHVRFVHFSVQEYLTGRYSMTLSEVGHREIAQTCIISLTLFPKFDGFLDTFEDPLVGNQDDLLLDLTLFDFREVHHYIFKEWPHHLLAGNLNSLPVDDPLVTLALSFLEKCPILYTAQPSPDTEMTEKACFKFSPSVLALIFDLPCTQKLLQKYLPSSVKQEQLPAVYDENYNCLVFSDEKLAIHYATAELDSVPVARRLNAHGYSLDYSYYPDGERKKVPDWLQLSPLHSTRSTKMSRYLLENGASIAPQVLRDTFIDPLKYFSKQGDWGAEVFDLLVDRVADQDDKRLKDALYTAARDGKIGLIQLLLDAGVDVNAHDSGKYDNALQAAARCDNIKVVKLLLDKGADINALGGHYGHALQAAARQGTEEVTKLLLDRGADVNAQGGIFGDALKAAAYESRMEICELLLDRGADVNAQGGLLGTALQNAVIHSGKFELIKLLLDKGADVNAQGGTYGTALHAAVVNGAVDVIQLLLEKGADINTQAGIYGTVLQGAIVNGSIEVIQLLLNKGADVNTQGGLFGVALQAAAADGKVDIIQLLLENGADVNTLGGLYGTALQAAAARGEDYTIHLLLENGAEVNTQGGVYGTALQAAAHKANTGIVQLLLKNGADVHTQGGVYGTALQAAAHKADTGIVQLLLDKGPDVNSQGGTFGTALQAAAKQGNIEVVQLLLENGADVNIQGGIFGTALQAAAHKGSIEVIELLLDEGADYNARSGEYGIALKKMLEQMPTGAGWKMPDDTPLLREFVLTHALLWINHIPKSELAAETLILKDFLREERYSLDEFREILESRGWKRGGQVSEETESASLEMERDPYKNRDDDNKGVIEDEIEEATGRAGAKAGNETSHELQQKLLETPSKGGLMGLMAVPVWKRELLGFTVLVFLLYASVQFWGV